MTTIALITIGILIGQVPWLLAVMILWRSRDELKQIRMKLELAEDVVQQYKQRQGEQ